MKWGAMLIIALSGAYSVMVQCDAAKESSPWPGEIFICRCCAGTSNNSGTEGDNLVDDHLGALLNDEVMIIEQGNDRVRGLLDTDDVVGIEENHLFVHARK